MVKDISGIINVIFLILKERLVMAKRHNGEGSWGTKTINGIIYKRYRSPEGKDFYGKTQKEIKIKYEKWKDLNESTPTEQKTLDVVAEEWLNSKKKQIKNTTYDGYEYFIKDVLKNQFSRK